MDINTTMDQNIATLFSNIENFTQNEGILGKPVSHGDKTFIPVVTVSVGYGGGNTSGKMLQGNTGANQGSGNSGVDALGLGARISTEAVVVIDGNNVSVMNVNNSIGNMNQLMNKLPQMMGMGQSNQQQGQQGQQQNQQQGQSGQQSDSTSQPFSSL